MMGFKFKACRAAQRDLWDYAGERLAEGPMEQVERHLETCASCRREAAQWKRAHNLLGTAQSAPLPTARLGWMDLQDRIAADVAAFGPPRPDRRHTQQAVAQLIRPRRSQKISFLRPALAGSVALTLAAVLLTHRAPKTTPGESSAAPAVISAAPPAPSNPLAETSLLAALKQNSYSAPASSVPTDSSVETAPQPVKSAAVKINLAPNRIAAAPPLPPKAKTAKPSAPSTPRQAVAANHSAASRNDGAMKLKPHEPTLEEKAPDEAEVADGVIGTLVPVSHDENNGYY